MLHLSIVYIEKDYTNQVELAKAWVSFLRCGITGRLQSAFNGKRLVNLMENSMFSRGKENLCPAFSLQFIMFVMFASKIMRARPIKMKERKRDKTWAANLISLIKTFLWRRESMGTDLFNKSWRSHSITEEPYLNCVFEPTFPWPITMLVAVQYGDRPYFPPTSAENSFANFVFFSVFWTSTNCLDSHTVYLPWQRNQLNSTNVLVLCYCFLGKGWSFCSFHQDFKGARGWRLFGAERWINEIRSVYVNCFPYYVC